MKLHSYFRSSGAFRVRIALNLKGLGYDIVPWQMLKAEHQSEAYRGLAPFGLVPALEAEGQVLQQSLAIIEYLEARHPEPPLLPADELARAHARALAQLIACEIHPLNNLRVLKYLRGPLAASEAQVQAWYRHWCVEGLGLVEAELQRLALQYPGGPYAFGEQPGLAECLLVPQVFNARRYEVDMVAFPRIEALVARCMQLPAFERAQPSQQPDALA